MVNSEIINAKESAALFSTVALYSTPTRYWYKKYLFVSLGWVKKALHVREIQLRLVAVIQFMAWPIKRHEHGAEGKGQGSILLNKCFDLILILGYVKTWIRNSPRMS